MTELHPLIVEYLDVVGRKEEKTKVREIYWISSTGLIGLKNPACFSKTLWSKTIRWKGKRKM